MENAEAGRLLKPSCRFVTAAVLRLSANCPEENVRKHILQHEYEEAVKDEFSEKDHVDLLSRQAKEIGLTQEECANAEPLLTTQLPGYAWAWLAKESHWLKVKLHGFLREGIAQAMEKADQN